MRKNTSNGICLQVDGSIVGSGENIDTFRKDKLISTPISKSEEPLRCVSFLRMSTNNNHNVHKPEEEKCRIYAGS